MKKKNLIMLSAIMAFFYLQMSLRVFSKTSGDINLENVEALSSGESDYYKCYDIGTLDCPASHIKVQFIYY